MGERIALTQIKKLYIPIILYIVIEPDLQTKVKIMITAQNQKVTLPVAKAAHFLGYSISGLWKRFVRETKSKYSYPTYHAVTSGRLRIEEIESWLKKEGFGKELREAQSIQNSKQ